MMVTTDAGENGTTRVTTSKPESETSSEFRAAIKAL